MSTIDSLKAVVDTEYSFKGESFILGAPIYKGQVIKGSFVRVPLRTLNRHGLIAGATGTGKTKTLQAIAESLSNASVPVVMLDIKGDLSGIAAQGATNPIIQERYAKLGLDYKPDGFPTEFLTISKEKGVRLRATVSEFGPVLLSKILQLNDTQESFVSLIFKFCDDQHLPLLDLKDFTKVLQFVSDQGKAEIEKTYGKISTTSVGTILRKVIELQQQGGDLFFGEPSFETDDLMRIDSQGRGMINVIRVTDMQDKPKLFSTFLLQMLAELYATCPEAGDLDKPKLVMFIDEAHLIFEEASSALLQQIETIIKLIRSKGIGIFFCTQNPTDVPADVLGQLGFKVQHALRAFTEKDRKAIKSMAENFPSSAFYKTDELLTGMGIGEALVTLLNEKGMPTVLTHTMLVSPGSRMNILTPAELDATIAQSALARKYNQSVDSESAYEILSAKLQSAAAAAQSQATAQRQTQYESRPAPTRCGPAEKSMLETMLNNSVTRQAGRTAASVIGRSLLGALFKKR